MNFSKLVLYLGTLNRVTFMIPNDISFFCSNGIKIPFTPDYFERMLPSCMTDRDLKSKFIRHGYLYIPGFIEPGKVFSLRESYFNLFQPTIFKKNTPRRDGIFSGVLEYKVEEHGYPWHPAAKFVKSQEFNSFVNDEKFFDLAFLLLDSDATLLKRKPLRHFYNNTNKASRAHIDYTYLDNGSEKFITVWIPLGDIDVNGGGLIYLKNSQNLGLDNLREKTSNYRDRPSDHRPISHDLKIISEITGLPWLWSEFKAGDILVHSPFIVHASLDLNSDTMRLSTDLRFVPMGSINDPRWSKDWVGNDGL